MGEITRYIVSVDKVDPSKALAALMGKREMLSRCEPGWGWSFRVDNVWCFCRKTKTGYSITERADVTKEAAADTATHSAKEEGA